MALRPSPAQKVTIRENALDYEIVQEQAAALGRLGRVLEAALRNLAAYDASEGASGDGLAIPRQPSQAVRMRLIEHASYALWCFMVQREACGLRDQASLVREYRVPAEVRNRVGAFRNR
jgi:hypothetical protein